MTVPPENPTSAVHPTSSAQLTASATVGKTPIAVDMCTQPPDTQPPVPAPPTLAQLAACACANCTNLLVQLQRKENEVRGYDVVPGADAPRCQLEDFTTFSKSHLWKLMMSFYDRQGVDSWAQGIVPHFITSNTFIAKRYSNVLRAFMRDAMRPNAASPVRIC
jgi:hypothetical protein